MFKGLIGKKIGMTQIFDENGAAQPVTLIEAGPCFVTQIRRVESEGYSAVQLGFEEVKPKRLSGGEIGHLKRINLPPLKYLREFRAKEIQVAEGDKVDVSLFAVGEKVDIAGVSKGKGFAGTIKRHNFHRGRKTHGGRSYRRVGSIGSMYPQHILKGKKMAGRLGHTRVTIKNLEIALVETDMRIIGVYGAVPGPKKSLVLVKGMSK